MTLETSSRIDCAAANNTLSVWTASKTCTGTAASVTTIAIDECVGGVFKYTCSSAAGVAPGLAIVAMMLVKLFA